MTSASAANRQIARAAGMVMAAFVISNLVGLLRQMLVANAFGTQAGMEAFNAANRVSETLFNLVAGGALSSAFIPVFTAFLTRKDSYGAWRLASSIANLILLVLIVLCLIAAIFAPWIVRHILAPGFASDPSKEALTVDLMRLMLPAAILFGLSGLVIAILNSNQVFFVPALMPSMYQLGMIFGVLFLSPNMGIYGLGWGVLIGSALYLGLQIPSLLRLHGKYFPKLGLDNPAVQEVLLLMLPRLLGVAVVQLNFWVNTWLASSMVEGSVTGVVLAFALMLMPQAAIAQSIAIAAMPTFSAQVALGKLGEMRNSLAASLRGVLLLSFPAAVGLILFRVPLIGMLYQRGQFDANSTQLVAWALLWFAVGLVSHSVVEIMARAFYALHDTRTPVLVGIGAMSLNVIFSFTFAALFVQWGWLPLGGLALANSLATTLEMAGLLVLMRRRLDGIQGGWIAKGLLQAMVATLIMGIGLWFWLSFSADSPAWLVTLGGVAIGLLLYAAATILLRVDEVQRVIQAVRKWWRSKLTFQNRL